MKLTQQLRYAGDLRDAHHGVPGAGRPGLERAGSHQQGGVSSVPFSLRLIDRFSTVLLSVY